MRREDKSQKKERKRERERERERVDRNQSDISFPISSYHANVPENVKVAEGICNL